MKPDRLVPALVAALLAACAGPGDDSVVHARLRPLHEVSAPRSLSATPLSSAAWPQHDWWTSFGDAQLDRLVRAALEGEPNLRIAEARVRQAEAVAGVVGAASRPQATATLRATEQRFTEHGLYPRGVAGEVRSVDEAQFGASHELDFWGRNRALFAAALDRAHASEVDAQAARLLLTTGVARVYLRLDTAWARRDLARDTLRQREAVRALVQRRVAMRIDSSLELTQAEAALPAIRAQIAALDETIALANNQLAALQGQGPDAGLGIERPHLGDVAVVAIPSSLSAELLGRRPDVVAQRWRVEAMTQDVAAVRAGFYPNVTLSAFVGLQSIGVSDVLNAGSRMLGIGPAISLPVFDAGRLRASLALRRAESDAAIEAYNATLIAALHDVVTQLVSLRWLADESAEEDLALELARRSHQFALDRYRSGLASYLQVLSAEAQVLVQQRQVIDSAGRQRELRLELMRALGGGFAAAAEAAASAPA